MNRERRKQSEQWVRDKAYEFDKANSDLTFAEWCYQQGKADREKEICDFLKEIANGDDVNTKLLELIKENKNG